MKSKEKIWAFVSYLPLLFIIGLTNKKSEFIHYHAKQGMMLFVLGVILIFAFWIPIANFLLWIAFIVIWVMGVINALSGKKEPAPIVGRLAESVKI